MSEAKIRYLYENIGVQISAGEVSNLLIKGQEPFHAEKEAVCEAGLASTPWQHTDQTSTRVDGQNQHCNIVRNSLYTVYTTTPKKDRLSVLDVLRPGRDRRFRLNGEALGYLESTRLSKATRTWLSAECSDQDWDEQTFEERSDTNWPMQNEQQRQAILSAAAWQRITPHWTCPLFVCCSATMPRRSTGSRTSWPSAGRMRPGITRSSCRLLSTIASC